MLCQHYKHDDGHFDFCCALSIKPLPVMPPLPNLLFSTLTGAMIPLLDFANHINNATNSHDFLPCHLSNQEVAQVGAIIIVVVIIFIVIIIVNVIVNAVANVVVLVIINRYCVQKKSKCETLTSR